jgi:sortase A
MWKLLDVGRREPIVMCVVSQNPERWWSVWKWIERALFASGLSLLAVFGAVRLNNTLSSRAAMESFTAHNSTPSSEARSYEETRPPADEPGSANGGGAHTHKDRQANRPGVPMAVVQIPRIHLAVPLLEGTDERTLSRDVGHIAGTARPGEMGNIGIAGHRDSFFRGLKDIKLGDAIELKTVKGTDTYEVDQIDIVTPDDVSVLRPRATASLTLVTCYPFHFIGSAPQRYIVGAFLTHETSSGPGSSLSGSASSTSNTTQEENK